MSRQIPWCLLNSHIGLSLCQYMSEKLFRTLHCISANYHRTHNENENFEISVLIRADHYWYFVEDHVICGNGPTAVQSRVGYLLSGPLPSGTHVSTTLVHIFHVSATSTDTTCHLEKSGKCKFRICRCNSFTTEDSRSTIIEVIH